MKKVLIGMMLLSVCLSAQQWVIEDIGSPGPDMMFLGVDVGDGNNDGIKEVYGSTLPKLVNYGGFAWVQESFPAKSRMDTTSYVYQYTWNGTNWDITGLVEPGGAWILDCCVGDGNNDNAFEVYATAMINPDAGCHQYNWNGTTWDSTILGPFGIGSWSVVCGDGDNNDSVEVYAIGGDSLIHRFQWNGSNWNEGNLGAIPQGLHPLSISIGDANNDGDDEVYVAFQRSGVFHYELHQFIWNETNWEPSFIDSSVSFHSHGLAVGDGNNDGENEIYTTTYSGGIYQFKWDGTTFQKTLVYNEGHELTRLCVGDGDNTGTKELYVADYGIMIPPTGGHLFKYEWDESTWLRTDIGEITAGGIIGSVNGVCIGDGDNDGLNEVYCTMSHYVFRCSWVLGIEEEYTFSSPLFGAIDIYPNPLSQTTVIRYSLGVNSKNSRLTPYSLRIYEVSGRLVKDFSLSTNHFSLTTAVSWDGRNERGEVVPSGIYYVILEANNKRFQRKLMLIR